MTVAVVDSPARNTRAKSPGKSNECSSSVSSSSTHSIEPVKSEEKAVHSFPRDQSPLVDISQQIKSPASGSRKSAVVAHGDQAGSTAAEGASSASAAGGGGDGASMSRTSSFRAGARSDPPAAGSKPIPNGLPNCLEGLKIAVTGVSEESSGLSLLRAGISCAVFTQRCVLCLPSAPL